MRYTSTRDTQLDVSFVDALLGGYAPDGGLYVPANNLPRLPLLHTLKEYSYTQLAFLVLRLFIDKGELDNDCLQGVCEAALAECAPPTVHALKTKLSMAHLFHGPTFCFKDYGVRLVVALLDAVVVMSSRQQQQDQQQQDQQQQDQQQQQTQQQTQPPPPSLTLLVATTGDTGPAAAHAVASQNNNNNSIIHLVVHYPQNQISNFQRRQLLATQQQQQQQQRVGSHQNHTGKNGVQIVAFAGSGDDMDGPIHNLLAASKRQQHKKTNQNVWSGINSYNIGRPIGQVVYWVWIYLRVLYGNDNHNNHTTQQEQQQQQQERLVLDVVVPTGAMGNVLAGYWAQQMGLPIRTLVCGVNANDIVHRVVQSGAFVKDSNTMHRTLSEAINIQVPYNFERLLFSMADRDCTVVKRYYETFQQTGRMDLEQVHWKRLRTTVQSARVTDEQVCDVTRRMYNDYNQYLVDPHTAVACSAAEQLGYFLPDDNKNDKKNNNNNKNGERTHCVIFATASPVKFEHAITTATSVATWQTYLASDAIPKAARRLLATPPEEQPPIVYDKHGTLTESQAVWERQTRELIDELERRER